MLLTMMAMTIQLATPAGDPRIEIPDSALRDPYGFILSHCSPLVRRSSETLDACEYRVGEALRTRLPDFRTRPPATVVASGADEAPSARSGMAFGGRCTTRQEEGSDPDAGSSSSSRTIVCGDRSGAAARVLDSLMRPN